MSISTQPSPSKLEQMPTRRPNRLSAHAKTSCGSLSSSSSATSPASSSSIGWQISSLTSHLRCSVVGSRFDLCQAMLVAREQDELLVGCSRAEPSEAFPRLSTLQVRLEQPRHTILDLIRRHPAQ